MRVYFEAPTGALLPLTVAPESSVQETRRRISDRLKLPPEAVDLTFGGRKLQDDALLWANGIRSGSTIHVHLLEIAPKNLREDVWHGWRPASLVDSLFNTCGCSHEVARCSPVLGGRSCFPAGSPAACRRAHRRYDLEEGVGHESVRSSSRELCTDCLESVNSETMLLAIDKEFVGAEEQPQQPDSFFMRHVKHISAGQRSGSVGRKIKLRARTHPSDACCIWSRAGA